MEPKGEESEILELKDPDEAYVRDLLVASGLYDGSFLRRWETLSKPISVSVFEQVEESYKKPGKDSKAVVVDHKLLHHLLNEALSTVVGKPSGSGSEMKSNWAMSFPSLHGKELFDCVWEIMRQHLSDQSAKPNIVDELVGRDMRMTLWSSGAMEDVVNSVGKEMECLIMADLVHEFVDDLILWRGDDKGFQYWHG